MQLCHLDWTFDGGEVSTSAGELAKSNPQGRRCARDGRSFVLRIGMDFDFIVNYGQDETKINSLAQAVLILENTVTE